MSFSRFQVLLESSSDPDLDPKPYPEPDSPGFELIMSAGPKVTKK